MPGVIEDVIAPSYLDDPAEVHDSHPVAHLADGGQVVGYEDDADPEFISQFREKSEYGGLDGDVEGRDWLVRHDDLRLDGQRPGDGDSLALTARK